MNNNTWTQERTETLKTLWAQGFSTRQIAIKLGNITRGAVIGKAHRMKLPRRRDGYEVRVRGSSKGKKSRTPAHKRIYNLPDFLPRVPVKIVDKSFDLQSLNLDLLELQNNTCRWPVTDTPPHKFCGHYTSGDHPYCKHHTARSMARPYVVGVTP